MVYHQDVKLLQSSFWCLNGTIDRAITYEVEEIKSVGKY